MTTRSIRWVASQAAVVERFRREGGNAESIAELDACMAGHLTTIRPDRPEDDLPSAYKGKASV